MQSSSVIIFQGSTFTSWDRPYPANRSRSPAWVARLFRYGTDLSELPGILLGVFWAPGLPFLSTHGDDFCCALSARELPTTRKSIHPLQFGTLAICKCTSTRPWVQEQIATAWLKLF